MIGFFVSGYNISGVSLTAFSRLCLSNSDCLNSSLLRWQVGKSLSGLLVAVLLDVGSLTGMGDGLYFRASVTLGAHPSV